MDIVTVASYIIVAFFVITIIGVIVGGKTFGGVIGGGIVTIIVIAIILTIFAVVIPKLQAEKDHKASLIKEKEKQELVESLSIEEKKSKDSNFIRFRNKCNKQVDLTIHYLNTLGEWKTEGIWSFDKDQVSYLSSNENRLQTNNSILFYHISGDGISFNGSHRFSQYGDIYYMKKVSDNYDTTEWSYSCE